MSGPSLHALPAIAPTEETAMRPAQRFDHSAIVRRPKLKLPRRARMIVRPALNIDARVCETRPRIAQALVSGALRDA